MMDETALEQEIQDKGLTAPRLTPDDIDNTIANVSYHRFTGTTVTVCCITTKNGFNSVGHSACVSPDNFDEQIGCQVAFREAREQLWQLEGYLLKQRLHEQQLSQYSD